MGKPRLGVKVDPSLLKVPQYCCEVQGCRKYFSKLSRLKYHQNTHLEEKPYKCGHEGCSSSYYRPNHLKRHVEKIHTKTETCSKPLNFVCSKEGCGAGFESEKSLYYHTKRKHSVLPLQCSYCDKRFSKKWMFKEHEAGHTGDSPFKCDAESCRETFKDYSLFKAHKRDHEKKVNVKSLTCSVEGCTVTCNKWSELVAHKQACHPAERQCSICQKTFSPNNLKIHRQIHEEERVTFQCPFDGCPRFYFQQRNLSHHMRIIHEGLGFKCKICDRNLCSKQKLDHHVEVIHNNRNTRRVKVKKLASVLTKLTSMTESDFDLKRTGPARYVRLKYNCVKFPSVAEKNDASTPSNKQSTDNVNNMEESHAQ